MRISVVINTYNRAASLDTALDALRHQRHNDFEVVVVNGPSEDATDDVLARYERVRVVRCPDVHLSKSRNLGIDAAAGEIVAFLDDDAVPEPAWLQDLETAYVDDHLGGAGGLVLDHTGVGVQYRYSTCNRMGLTDFEGDPPFNESSVPGADPFVYLQGTNASFRRTALEQVSGFDEEIEYNYDEVELCLQLIDAGWRLEPLSGAVVHHKFLPSYLRAERGVVKDPYLPIKNRAYFALRNGRPMYEYDAIFASLVTYLEQVRAGAKHARASGTFSQREYDYFLVRLREGFQLGVERGLRGERQSRAIAPRPEGAFRPFAVLRPQGRRLTACLVSVDYPPKPEGGISRLTSDLANGLSSHGHEVHVITRDDSAQLRVDFEGGVWVHRYPVTQRWVPDLAEHPLRGSMEHMAAVHAVVDSVAERTEVDIVSGPLWAAEPLICAMDPRWVTVMTCMTPMRVAAETQPAVAALEEVPWRIRLEDAAVLTVDHLQALSQANLERLRSDVPTLDPAKAEVIWPGVRDQRAAVPRSRGNDDLLEVLFVGRLEPRKGVDVLLGAAIDLLRGGAPLRVRLVGSDSGSAMGGSTYERWLAGELSNDRALLERFVFEGQVCDEQLYRRYADADIFCAPSRYESFGLVLAEAMMMGLPVVACDVGGMPELLAENAGTLVPPGDRDALRAALGTLIEDPALRDRQARAGRARYEREFQHDVAVTRTESYYMALVEQDRDEAKDAFSVSCERLADLLADVAELPSRSAARAANELLSPAAFPTDPRPAIRRALRGTDREFLEACFAAVLGREADADWLAGHASSLASPESRLAITRDLAASAEARARGLDPQILEDLSVIDVTGLERDLRRIWHNDDETFAGALVGLLNGTPTNPDDVAEIVDDLRSGVSRRDLVERLLRLDWGSRAVAGPRRPLPLDIAGPDLMIEEIARLAGLSDDDFVMGLYVTLLGRLGDPDGLSGHVRRLRTNASRADLIRNFAVSDEAKRRGIDVGWIPEVVRRHPRLELPARRGLVVKARAAAHRLRRRVLGTELRNIGSGVESYGREQRVNYEQTSALLDAVNGRVSAVQAEVVGMSHGLNAVRGDRDGLTSRIDTIIERMDGAVTEHRQLATQVVPRIEQNLAELGQRLSVMHAKQEAMAVDLRDHVPVHPQPQDLPTPIVTDPEGLDRKVANSPIRLNLGAGEKPLSGYVNVDFRPLPGVEVVADVRRLPFEAGTVDEIASAHLVEHFRQNHLARVILPYWRSLLVPDGVLRIICPNWDVMIQQLSCGQLTMGEFKQVTFGLQDYAGDDHFAMYTPESLMTVLEEAGFDRFDVLATDRQNGLSPELELLARPAGGDQ